MAVLSSVGRLWELAKKVEELLKLQDQVKDTVKALDQRLRQVEDRLIRLEIEQPHVIDKARDAAAAASQIMCGAVLSDVVTRLTRMEIFVEELKEQAPSDPKRLASQARASRRKKNELEPR